MPVIEGLEARLVQSDAEFARARRLHASCYLDAGYVDASAIDSHGFIDDPWVRYSDYYVAVDLVSDDIVGTCRLIRPSVRGFPLFEHFEGTDEAHRVFDSMDPNRCVEISALATSRAGIQNTAISAELYGLVWREAIRNDRAYMLAIMDSRLLRIMRRWFHFPFEPLGPGRQFMGDFTSPVAMYIPRTIEHFRAASPESLRFFSRDITFSQLDELAIDLRNSTEELKVSPVQARRPRAAQV